jgi:hypothetical protein
MTVGGGPEAVQKAMIVAAAGILRVAVEPIPGDQTGVYVIPVRRLWLSTRKRCDRKQRSQKTEEADTEGSGGEVMAVCLR